VLTRRATAAALALPLCAVTLAACSGGPTAVGASPAAAIPAQLPTFDACRLVSRSRASSAVDSRLGAGVPDVRGTTAGLVQSDGCIYTGPTGTSVAYLAWKLVAAPDTDLVRRGLAPKSVGATRFDPDLGSASAGAVLDQGPVSVAQVNAARRGRLVQVTVVGDDAATARAAAIAAARTAVTAS
jgi:hypothetical protein